MSTSQCFCWDRHGEFVGCSYNSTPHLHLHLRKTSLLEHRLGSSEDDKGIITMAFINFVEHCARRLLEDG
jgi:hypothetical protein